MSRVVNLLSLAVEAVDGTPPGHTFSAASVTEAVGARLSGLSVYELPPGQAGWPYHFELGEEEWAIVLAGEVTLRTPAGERVLRLGDVACFPAGADGAHAFRNDGDRPARFAMPSAGLSHIDACVYPDSGKIKVSGRGFWRRFDIGPERDYWEREP